MSTPFDTKPQLVLGIDIRKLPIGPQEAFVLSRIDGDSTARDIGYATSLNEDDVIQCLQRLAALGAVTLPGQQSSVPPPKAKSGPVEAQSTTRRGQPPLGAPLPRLDPIEVQSTNGKGLAPLRAPMRVEAQSTSGRGQPPLGAPVPRPDPIEAQLTSARGQPPLGAPVRIEAQSTSRGQPPLGAPVPRPDPIEAQYTSGRGQPPLGAPVRIEAQSPNRGQPPLGAPPVPRPDPIEAQYTSGRGLPPLGAPMPVPETVVIREASRSQTLSAATKTPTPIAICAVGPLYDPAELDAPGDLDRARKQEILDLYYRLDRLDYYALLAVPTNADRRAIKSAYYDKVKILHPDRYFGKDLGSFRSKLEQCFTRLTTAHDTLTNAQGREEYDAYLDVQKRAEEMERALSQTVTLDDLDILEEQLGAAAATAETKVERPASSKGSDPAMNANPGGDLGSVPRSEPSSRMSHEDRKRLLARKLQVSSASLRAPPRTSLNSSTPPPTSPKASKEQIAEQLKRTLGASRREELHRQLEAHLASAEAALKSNDPVAAANALRVAHSIAPADESISTRLQSAQALAATALSDTYLRQAEYEEKSGRFDAAARSYERAARGKPTATVWEAAARCMLEAGVDLRSASEFARLSIALDQERPTSHLVLGRIFLAANMRSSAIAELERARTLDPKNDTVLNLLKRISDGTV